MKLCILTTSFPQYDGDKSGSFILDVLRPLEDSIENIIVVAPHSALSRGLRLKNIKIVRFVYFFPRKLQKLAYIHGIESNLRLSWLSRFQLLFFLPSFFLTAFIQCRKVDIIHAHWTMAGFIAVIISKLLRKKVVVTVHGTDIDKAGKGWMNLVNSYTLSNADAVISVSNYLANQVSKRYKDVKNIYVIPDGIILGKYKERKKILKLQGKIIFIGRLHPSKGVDILLNALKELNKKLPAASLSIIGSGESESSLKNLASKLALEKKVVFIGERARSKMPTLLSKADILILPSRREGFGLVLIEAMAAGLPVIGSDIGGISDIIQEGYSGFKFPVGDYKKLSSLAYMLLTNKDQYKKLSLNARTLAKKKFSINLVAEKHLDLYLKL